MKYINKKKNCRLCGNKKIDQIVKLCNSPLANNLANSKKESLKAKNFPLNLMLCSKCYHVQLEHVVDAKKLYNQYLYMTGVSQGFRDHFKVYAKKIIKYFKNSNKNLKILEIGSNDCTLLDNFKNKKWQTVGIEPAKNLYNITKKKHYIINDYYNVKTNKTLKKKFNKFDLIIANNVFAHIDNLKFVFVLLKPLLHNKSLIVFEVSYLLDVIRKKLFDTIYHEHLDYHSIIPLKIFFKKMNLKIINIEHLSVHGGSIRVFVAKKTSNIIAKNDKINAFINKEKEYKLIRKKTYVKFYNDLTKQRNKLNNFFDSLKNEKVYGYGAPAKAVTLINFFNLDHNNIKLIVDDSALKQNKYIPGSKIKIYKSQILTKKPPKFIVILAWNVYEDILKKLKRYKKIKYAIVPLPTFKLIKL